MGLKEILNRETPIEYTQKEMCFIVESYVKERKGVDIICNPLKPLNAAPKEVQALILRSELTKLLNAVNIALEWFYNEKYHV